MASEVVESGRWFPRVVDGAILELGADLFFNTLHSVPERPGIGRGPGECKKIVERGQRTHMT